MKHGLYGINEDGENINVFQTTFDSTSFALNELKLCFLENIESLSCCKELDLSENKFQSFPSNLNCLSTLEVLNFNFNVLYNVSDFQFRNFQYLKELQLSGNQIEKLPLLKDLINLQILSINSNQLSNLNNCGIESLKKLEILLANQNSISEIENLRLDQLENLTFIDLNNNLIEKTPAMPPNLETLHV